ncbi:Flp pilus assembly protein CpaB [Cryptosporangium phraense]|uniref:Flp pilus assembly protein CpaB n=1 Tax=Cryptosporangium phraense TaxID=2593070 RepID=A0A545AHC6_9ACTN|nr:Flp pilus assembly protein CpaB [Cryptosporangium phraense]TQS40723.1 Flp pilus assembly protein CpaB [Cryptosporangium phraense]
MRRRLLALALAFVLALLGCVGILAYVGGADDRAVAGKKPVEVLVASTLLPAGTTGAELRNSGKLKTVQMPAETVPSDALGTIPAGLDNLALTADVQPSQLLLRGALGRKQTSTGGLTIPAGKLAVSVDMTGASRVAGYVRPGSEVAVFYTYKPTADEANSGTVTTDADKVTATRVLLPRVQVLAIGEAGAVKASSDMIAVTLATTQTDAERLVQASQTGTLSLGLLNDAVTVEPGSGVDTDTLFR